MDILDKAVKVAKEVGNTVVSTAANVGNTISTVTKEQTDLASMKIQRNSLEKNIQKIYAIIGKKYMECVEDNAITLMDGIEEEVASLKADMETLEDINQQLAARDNKSVQNNLAKDKKKAEEKFEAEKDKLDKALAMDILSQEEYDEKLACAQKKLDLYEAVRKIDLQYEMQIIDKEEHDEKIAKLMN